MAVPAFVLNAFAANESLVGTPGDQSIIGSERQNWAPNGSGYHSSVWNNDRHSKYLNNGTLNHSYQWWEPTDPARPNGNGVDPTKQYFGFTFDDGYYLLDEIVIYAESYVKRYGIGYNNIKYRVEALILGEWVEVGVGYQDDAVPATEVSDGTVDKLTIPLSHPDGLTVDKYKCSKCSAICDTQDTCTTKDCDGTLKALPDINTNNIRVWCSEYGYYAKRYGEFANQPATTHDWWLTPQVQEVELNGVTGYRPEFDVPMNAYLVTNAALSGMIGAGSSLNMYHPGSAGDDTLSTYWKSRTTGPNNIWAEFDKEYTIDNVGFNVGGCKGTDVGVTLTYNIKVLVDGTLEDGTWEYVVKDQTAVTESEVTDYIIHELDEPMTVKAMMIEFTSAKNSSGKNARPVVSELWAEISEGGKCIFLADYITTLKKISTATGNLACYGAAYASSNFSYAGVSKASNIIDGSIGRADHAWIANDYLIGTYVGVTLREAHNVTKVALYFDNVLGGTNGEHVFQYDVQAKVDGEFVTVATGTSYDSVKKSYNVAIELPEAVYTDDVRIVFKSDAHTFPYLTEFEVFEDGYIYSSYDGYALDISRVKGGPLATEEFGDRTVTRRGKYFNEESPLSYFNIALEHDVQIDWLG